MRKVYCELHIFDLHQNVYVVDMQTGNKERVAITTIEELPEVINAVCNDKKIYKVLLSGNSVMGDAIAEDVINFAKKNYGWNNIKVEVLK